MAEKEKRSDQVKFKFVIPSDLRDYIEPIEFRDISREEAKREIRQFFKDRHGENLSAGEIMDELNIEYSLVLDICEELEREGEIGHP